MEHTLEKFNSDKIGTKDQRKNEHKLIPCFLDFIVLNSLLLLFNPDLGCQVRFRIKSNLKQPMRYLSKNPYFPIPTFTFDEACKKFISDKPYF